MRTEHERHAWGIALLRVVLGTVLVAHGWQALRAWVTTGAVDMTTTMGYPLHAAGLLTSYAVVVQLVGGALIVLGLWTSVMAVLQVPVLASAVFLRHWREGFFMRGVVVDTATGHAVASGYELALVVLAATLALALLGGGALSLDRRRGRRTFDLEMP